MDFGISGKKAVVCAASKGLGRAIALALAAEGVELLVTARNKETLAEVAGEALKLGAPKAHMLSCDLTQHAAREELIKYASSTLGHVDILIHNVGGPKPTAALATTLDHWRSGYDQLFPFVAHLNGAFLPGMIERSWGRIVAVTSLSVLEPIANLAISNAFRSAVTAMLKTLSDEVAHCGVTINCVAPGLIATDRTEDLMSARIAKSGQSREEYMTEYLKSIPAQRLGKPQEFGAVVAFLCSQQASYVTGSTICVDGGKRRSTY
ncbi:MAG: SDR family oxidoreductase [Terriglobales bacterium]